MIIITGGAGFIGSAIAAQLNKQGQTDILIVDELGTDEKWKNLRNLKYIDYTEKGDFINLVIEDKIDFPVEALIHMGACSSTTETDCSYLVKNNFQYSKILAEWSLKKGVRFIGASSAATYGDGELGFEDDHDKIEQLQPLNMYGYSKQMFDLWAKNNGLLDKIVSLKYFNVFGPNEYHKADMRSFVLKAFLQINETGKVKLFKSHHSDYKDGQQLRDFIYVQDAVDMTLFFMENKDANGIFNIGTGTALSWDVLASSVFAAMDRPANIEYIDMPDHLREKYQYFTQADITKLKNAGYDKPTTSLEDSIKDYVQNYLTPNKYLNGT